MKCGNRIYIQQFYDTENFLITENRGTFSPCCRCSCNTAVHICDIEVRSKAPEQHLPEKYDTG